MSGSLSFSGYIPLHRALVQHTIDGRLSNNEALTLVWLLMLADRKTGSYTINGPTLRFFLPGLSKSGAQDALEGLERKRYIYRDVKPRSSIAYRYWVNGFQPTDGPYKCLQLDLSEVFNSRDTSKLRYVKVAPDSQLGWRPETQPDSRLGTPKYNEKGEERSKNREKRLSITSIGECASYDALDAPHLETVCASEAALCGKGGAPDVRLVCRPCAEDVPPTSTPVQPKPSGGAGLIWSGADGAYRDAITHRIVPFDTALERINKLGLKPNGQDFIDKVTSTVIPWAAAQQRIRQVPQLREVA